MEDILSSIRRIISEDGDQKSEAVGEDVPEAEAIPEAEAVPEETAEIEAPDEGDDVFDLTEMVDDAGNVVKLGEEADDEGVSEVLEGDEEGVCEGVEEDIVASTSTV